MLAWFEAETRRPIPVYSHGALWHEGFSHPRAITLENLRRLRALGGVIGFTPAIYETPEALKAGIEAAAALPFRGRPGYDGIALGTDFLGVDRTTPGLGTAAEVVAWVQSAFDRDTAAFLIQGNARLLLDIITGVAPIS